MKSQYVWFLIFGVLAYIIATDPNIARAYNYVLELANTNIDVGGGGQQTILPILW